MFSICSKYPGDHNISTKLTQNLAPAAPQRKRDRAGQSMSFCDSCTSTRRWMAPWRWVHDERAEIDSVLKLEWDADCR